jgi:hypothetical protein
MTRIRRNLSIEGLCVEIIARNAVHWLVNIILTSLNDGAVYGVT